jgi:hypothetical protein
MVSTRRYSRARARTGLDVLDRSGRARDVDDALSALSAFFDDDKWKHATIEKTSEGIFVRVKSHIPYARDDEP